MIPASTPNFDLPYLDPSQAQPEVKINDSLNKIDAALADASTGSGGSGTDGKPGKDGSRGRRGKEGERGHRVIVAPTPALIVPRQQVVVARISRNVRRLRNRPPGMPLVIPNSGVSAGAYTSASITVGADGRITSAANGNGSTAIIPGTIPDLALWWESEDIIASSGTPIYRLRERTPWLGGILAANTTNGGATIDTTQLNSLNVVKWGASSTVSPYQLTNTLLIAPTANPAATFFVVCKPATSTGAQAFIGAPASSNALAFYLNGTSGTPKISLIKTGASIIGTATPSWTVGTWFQANATYNGTTGAYAFRQGRATAGSGTGATVAGGSGAAGCTQIGSDSTSTNFLSGASLAALIAYNRILSPTEIVNVENYLNAKWGV